MSYRMKRLTWSLFLAWQILSSTCEGVRLIAELHPCCHTLVKYLGVDFQTDIECSEETHLRTHTSSYLQKNFNYIFLKPLVYH